MTKKTVWAAGSIALAALLMAGWTLMRHGWVLALARAALTALACAFLWALRPASRLHRIPLFPMTRVKAACCALVVLAVALACILPMPVNPMWGHDGFAHHHQYQKMTDSVLAGRLDLDYGQPDPRLLAMENPYDPQARDEMGVICPYDHAWYQGKYYMYFGIVPVFLLFLPLRLCGVALTECAATQIFVALLVAGLFYLAWLLVREYQRRISLPAYLAMSAASCAISGWYFILYPSLYGTAISSGVCLAVWGLCLAFRGLVQADCRHRTACIALGSTLGALVFGCRPTVGFVSLVYLPMVWICFRTKRATVKRAVAFALPYGIVAALLMLYNAARFGSPFEFGQRYQLTVADQQTYGSAGFALSGLWEHLRFQFLSFTPPCAPFPYIHMDGVLLLFPVLLCGIPALVRGPRRAMGWTIVATVLLTCAVQSMWCPWPEPRYTMDFNYLLCLLMLLGVCRVANQKHASAVLTWLGAHACAIAFLLYFCSYDYSLVDVRPQLVEQVKQVLFFWK